MITFPRGGLAAGAIAACLVAPAAATAQATLPLAPCRDNDAVKCGGLDVPLDRAQPQGEHLLLSVRVVPGKTPVKGVVVLLAGGPGEAAISPMGSFERIVAAAAPDRDVVVFDERGTGATALRCRAFGPGGGGTDIAAASESCAAELGPRREHFATADTVADIEDLRVRLGVPTLSLVGVSYGSLVAQAYARTYPSHVDHLVLDSVVDPAGTQWNSADSYAAARRILAELCSGSRCRGITGSVRRDVARVTARLARGPIPGVVVANSGRPRRVMLRDPGVVFSVLSTGDLLPAIRTAFPSAVRAAADGDATALLRLAGVGEGSAADNPRRFSTALLATTLCGESSLPWPADASPDQRRVLLDEAVRGQSPAQFAPFAPPGAGATMAQLCVRWPATGRVALPSGPLPDVPTLLLEGSQDTRTPVETARRVRAEVPRGHLLVLKGAGHSVLARGNRCVGGSLAAFFAGRRVRATCAAPAEAPSLVPVPPTRLSAVAPQKGLAGTRGRTLHAARLTVRDAAVGLTFGRAAGPGVLRFRGLRSGTAEIRLGAPGVPLTLSRYEYVPGLFVSGTVKLDPGASKRFYDLRVTGPTGSPGVIHVRNREAYGVLGGRPFRVLLPPTR